MNSIPKPHLCFTLIAAGHTVFKSLFPAFGKAEPVYGYGDAQFRLEMKRLAEASKPLIMMRDGSVTLEESKQMPQTSFQITERGQPVLCGDEDFIQANEINLWLGGVHSKAKTPRGVGATIAESLLLSDEMNLSADGWLSQPSESRTTSCGLSLGTRMD